MKDCIQTIKSIGETTYVDLCRNEVLGTVPWGSMDWLMLVFVMGCVLTIGTMLGVMLVLTTSDYRKSRKKRIRL